MSTTVGALFLSCPDTVIGLRGNSLFVMYSSLVVSGYVCTWPDLFLCAISWLVIVQLITCFNRHLLVKQPCIALLSHHLVPINMIAYLVFIARYTSHSNVPLISSRHNRLCITTISRSDRARSAYEQDRARSAEYEARSTTPLPYYSSYKTEVMYL